MWDGHEKDLKGGEALTTNNRMELTAAIEALSALKGPTAVDFYTDSQYVRGGVMGWVAGWKKNGLEDERSQAGEERRPVAEARCLGGQT